MGFLHTVCCSHRIFNHSFNNSFSTLIIILWLLVEFEHKSSKGFTEGQNLLVCQQTVYHQEAPRLDETPPKPRAIGNHPAPSWHETRGIALSGKVLHHLCCALSRATGILPTSDLNQSVTITAIFSSGPTVSPPRPLCAPVSLFSHGVTLRRVTSYQRSLSALLRMNSNANSLRDLFVFTSAKPWAGSADSSTI